MRLGRPFQIAIGIAALNVKHATSLHRFFCAAARRGICTEDTCAQILALLRQYGLPTETDFRRDALADAARADKKIADGALHLIVPERIGRCRIETVPAADIPAWLADGGIV